LAERRATARDPYLAREAQEFRDWKREGDPGHANRARLVT
jgi:hypothetical protein